MSSPSSVTAPDRRSETPAARGSGEDFLVRLTGRQPSTLAWIAMSVLLVAAGVFLLVQTRDTTLWRDELIWAQQRRGNGLDTFLEPHFGHPSIVSVAIYKLLFATAGLDHYTPYRVMITGAHLLCSTLVFVYAKRRVGPFLGLLAATLILFLGPAAQNILWPFQVAWLISLAAGLGALLMLDRRDLRGDVVASALVVVALFSSGIGIAIALGVAVDVAWTRRRWGDAWIAGGPLALYGLWSLLYPSGQTERWAEDVYLTPGWVFAAPASVLSSLAGVAGSTTMDGPDTPLIWGTPLAIAAVAVLVWRLARVRPISARVPGLLVAVLVFWIGTALSRAFFGGPGAGRYIYVGAIFVVLLAVELARGVSVSRRARVLLAVAVAAAAVSNLGAFRSAAAHFRGHADMTRTLLGTLEIARPLVKPDYASEGFLYQEVVAGPYFAASEEFGGTPAASPAEIATQREDVRKAADSQLAAIHQLGLQAVAATADPALGTRPTVESVAGGRATGQGPCLAFRPNDLIPALGTSEMQIAVPPAGLLVRAQGGPAAVGVRRFAGAFRPLGEVTPGASAIVRIRPDRAPQPWHLRVAPAARASVCGLRAG